jgi:hypothetical protein
MKTEQIIRQLQALINSTVLLDENGLANFIPKNQSLQLASKILEEFIVKEKKKEE